MSDANQGANNGKRLTSLLGFNPTSNNPSKTVMTTAMENIRKAKDEKALVKATELLTKAVDLQEKMEKARKQFQNESAKWDKELGKLLNQIDGAMAGKEPAPEAEGSEAAPAADATT